MYSVSMAYQAVCSLMNTYYSLITQTESGPIGDEAGIIFDRYVAAICEDTDDIGDAVVQYECCTLWLNVFF